MWVAEERLQVQVRNAGCEDVRLTRLAFGGVQPADRHSTFSFVAPEEISKLPAFPPSDDPAPHTATFEALFTPSAPGASSATMEIGAGDEVFPIAVSALGGEPIVRLTPSETLTLAGRDHR